MKKILALFSSLGIVIVAAFALLATPALAANPLLCFAGTPGTCLISNGVATLNNTSGGDSGVYTAVSSLTSKTLAQVDQLSFNYTGTPTAGSPRISLPVDMDANGTTDVYAFISANLCNNGSGLVDAIHNSNCKIFITGGDVGGYTGWAAFVAAFPSAKVGPDVPFVIVDDAGLWTVSNIHLGTATEQAAYTQADFKAFDGVSIGTNSYTLSSGITAAYTSGTGTLSDPVKLTLTGIAPIVTPWFGQNWTTYNYVTVGIKLPAGFTGTSVYQTGIMRYDVNPSGIYAMGTGSTALATAGAANGYLDYSFAANSTNTTKDGLVKLQVIWTAGGTPEYFTIDINGLQLDTLTHLILTVPAATTITRSTLVPETSGVPTGGNTVVDTAIIGLTPIAVTLANTGNTASANVRISPISAGPHIQLWAKDTSGNWFDINVTGWMDSAGMSIPVGFNRTTDVYIISDLAGTYPLTANLVLVSDSSIVAHATGTVTVNETAAEGCVAGNKFNTITGRNCNAATPAKVETPDGCAGGDKFSTTTGRNCNAATPARKVLSTTSSISHSIIKNGSKGNEVMELQNLLNTTGNDSGIADGKFGPKTKEAVIKFQNAHGLKGDGVVGALTREALNK